MGNDVSGWRTIDARFTTWRQLCFDAWYGNSRVPAALTTLANFVCCFFAGDGEHFLVADVDGDLHKISIYANRSICTGSMTRRAGQGAQNGGKLLLPGCVTVECARLERRCGVQSAVLNSKMLCRHSSVGIS